MSDIAAFPGFTQAVTLDCFCKDYGGLAAMIHRGFVGGIHFAAVMPTTEQFMYLIVCQMIDQLQQFGIFAEEMLAGVAAWLDGVFLIIAIDSFFHPLKQKAAFVRCEERIPVGSPNDFDHIPARALENGFQLLNDLAVAAHGTVEPLEVAVNDPD